MNISRHLRSAESKLADAAGACDSPRLEAEILMAHVLEVGRSFLYAHPEQDIPMVRSLEFKGLIKRRARGEPIAYLLGEKEFWSLPLKVTPDVLIPRPETELAVEQSLAHLPGGQATRVADIGSGSGAIAIALCRERPLAEIHAVDISEAALAVARFNAERLGMERIRFHLGSWCAPLEGPFDLLVSNPPYVAGGDPHLEQGDCRFEPTVALTLGDDGLDSFRLISEQAAGLLKPGGWLVFEHGHDQGQDVRDIMHGNGFSEPRTVQDLQGLDRVSLGQV